MRRGAGEVGGGHVKSSRLQSRELVLTPFIMSTWVEIKKCRLCFFYFFTPTICNVHPTLSMSQTLPMQVIAV